MYQVPVGSTCNPDRSCPLSGLTSEHVGSQLHWTAGALRVTLKIQAPALPYFIQTVSILNAETALEDNKEPSSWLMYHEYALSRLCCSEGPVPKSCIESPPISENPHIEVLNTFNSRKPYSGQRTGPGESSIVNCSGYTWSLDMSQGNCRVHLASRPGVEMEEGGLRLWVPALHVRTSKVRLRHGT